MLKKLILTTATIAAPFLGYAVITIPVYSEPAAVDPDGLYLNPDLSMVNDTYTIDLGFLDITFDQFNNLDSAQQQDYLDNLDTHFTSFAQFNFSASGTLAGEEDGKVYNGPIPSGASSGDRIYALVQDAANSLHGLFTSVQESGAAWTLPVDGGNRSLFLTAGTPTALIGSIDSGTNAVLEAVPEPSTYAFVAGLLTLGLVAYRRRQRA